MQQQDADKNSVRLSKEEFESNTNERSQLRTENEQLKDQLRDYNDVKVLAEKAENLQKELDIAYGQLKSNNETITEVLSQLGDQCSTTNLSSTISSLKAAVQKESESNRDLTRRLDDLQKQLDDTNQKNLELGQTVARKEAELDALSKTKKDEENAQIKKLNNQNKTLRVRDDV